MQRTKLNVLIVAGVLLAVVLPTAVVATHRPSNEHLVCGGGFGPDNEAVSPWGTPATIFAPNPAGRTGFGVTSTLFERTLLNDLHDPEAESGNLHYSWDYLQGFDGLVFEIIQKDQGAGALPGEVTASNPTTYSISVQGRSTSTNGLLDITVVFYQATLDGAYTQERTDAPISRPTAVNRLGMHSGTLGTMTSTLSGSFPAGTTHFAVNLNSGPARDTSVVRLTGLSIGFLETTAKVTADVVDTNGLLDCRDPVLARCLTELTGGGAENRNPSGLVSQKIIQCTSVSRLL